MRIIQISHKLEAPQLQEVIDLLNNQELIAYPTETCYGLGGDATQHDTIEKVFRVKQRPKTAPIHIAVSSLEMAQRYVKMDKTAIVLFKKLLPGPLTLIMESSAVLPPLLSAGRPTLGIRFPDHPIPQQIVEAFGRPITTTSANISGQPSTYTAKETIQQLEDSIAAIIDMGRLPDNPPSTVLDLTIKPYNILRHGPISEETILNALRDA